MKSLKIAGIIISALVITTLGIEASDTLRSVKSGLLGQIIGQTTAVCSVGMVPVATALSFSCVDQYEASPSSQCPLSLLKSATDSEVNLAVKNCRHESKAEALPWQYVSREQASRICARSGKRLPTAREWYEFAIDTDAAQCQTTGGLAKTGRGQCVSAYAVHDSVGNVWEWVSDDVVEGAYNDRQLPESGFVSLVDNGGVAVETSDMAVDEYDKSYFWSSQTGVFGMMRGGFYGSQSDAGVYTVQAATEANFNGEAVSFRCVR